MQTSTQYPEACHMMDFVILSKAARVWREGRSRVGRAWVRVVETQVVANSGSDEANFFNLQT